MEYEEEIQLLNMMMKAEEEQLFKMQSKKYEKKLA